MPGQVFKNIHTPWYLQDFHNRGNPKKHVIIPLHVLLLHIQSTNFTFTWFEAPACRNNEESQQQEPNTRKWPHERGLSQEAGLTSCLSGSSGCVFEHVSVCRMDWNARPQSRAGGGERKRESCPTALLLWQTSVWHQIQPQSFSLPRE